MSGLTGRRRYRLGGLFRKKLVLQVQFRDREYDPWGGYAVTRWRDATVEDLMTIEAAHRPFPVAVEERAG